MLLNKGSLFKHWFCISHNNKNVSGAPQQPGFKKTNIRTEVVKTFPHH